MRGKERLTISIDRKLLRWLDRQIKEKRFANRSHALEFFIATAMREDNLALRSKPKSLNSLRKEIKKVKYKRE